VPKGVWKFRQERPPLCLSPRGEHPARRKSAAPEPVERNLETGSIVDKLAANSPFAPLAKPLSSFLKLPVPCSDRKARSSSRPCKGGVIGAPAACQNAPLGAGPEDFLPLSWQKIPDPLLTGEDAEISYPARRGEALLT